MDQFPYDVGDKTTVVPDPIKVTVKSVGTGPVYGTVNSITAALLVGIVLTACPFTVIVALDAGTVYVPDPGM